jgi:hypothetical protein
VKTLGDTDAGRVSLEPLASTVLELASHPAPSNAELRQHANSRIDSIGDPPVELSTYTLSIVLVEFKMETDQDIHLVVADPDDASQTMIVEFPDANCLPGTDPALVEEMQAARDSLVVTCGEPQPRFRACTANAQVTGVGFFDFQHGQTGVAPNAVELHPVLDFQPAPPPAADNRPVTTASAPCRQGQIKANETSGIYHVPGGALYARTTSKVRCFDTEAEAQAAGFRKSIR